ncbi:MAG: hypothetical protein KZQ85_09475 [Candidatus Thiodiazotropha sp. (ex Myrtea sp. 'scaly one' KF741663)]|nr:hypothetical protein [Candidatus Thiodiazotropha sp. (ex Myrtea sp. 'scaly one' KF741663)]
MSAYKITEIGFEQPDAIFFSTTVEMASGYDISEWVCVGDEDADVILVNMDLETDPTGTLPDTFTQQNESPILVSCSQNGEKTAPFSHSLQKPITYSMLVILLQKLELELSAAKEDLPEPQAHEQEALESDTEQDSSTPEQEATPSETALPSETQETAGPSEIENAQIQIVHHDVAETLAEKVSPTPHIETNNVNVDTGAASDALSSENVIDLHRSSNTNHKVDTHLEMDRPARRFYDATRLLGVLIKAKKSGQDAEITHDMYPSLRIYPGHMLYAYTSNTELPPEMFRTLASGFSTRPLTKMSEKELQENWSRQPLWLLFFIATLYGSEGRLRENGSLDDRLRLISKPDFEMIPRHADYGAILSFMTVNPLSDLKTIGEGAGASIKTVVDFCNACEEIGILERIPALQNGDETHTISAVNTQQEAAVSANSAGSDKSLMQRIKSIFKQ